MNLPPQILASLGVGPQSLASTIDVDSPQRGKLVPNEFPAVSNPSYHVAVIGEAPGADEDQQGRPFCGVSGRFLDSLLTASGLSRSTVFVGNICNFRPLDNNLKLFSWSGPEIQSSLERLARDLDSFNPNVCILLGSYALFAACGEKRSITSWRGSTFIGTQAPFVGRKCIATYHPAAVL